VFSLLHQIHNQSSALATGSSSTLNPRFTHDSVSPNEDGVNPITGTNTITVAGSIHLPSLLSRRLKSALCLPLLHLSMASVILSITSLLLRSCLAGELSGRGGSEVRERRALSTGL
jgi:hypothetical protein